MNAGDEELPARFRGLPPLVYWHLAYASFYSERLRLHYIATPKAACTALKWWFAALEGIAFTGVDGRDSWESEPELLIHDLVQKAAPHIQSFDPRALERACADESVFRFALVRNPFTRIFSAWLSKLAIQEANQVAAYADADFLRLPITDCETLAIAFEGFLRHLAEHEAPDAWRNAHWAPQNRLLAPERIAYSRIFPVEDMPGVMSTLSAHLAHYGQVSPALGRYNENLLPYSSQYLTPTSIQLIARLYAEDFAAFGYDPQVPPSGHSLSADQVRATLSVMPHLIGRNRRWGELHQVLAEERAAHAVTGADRDALSAAVQTQWRELADLRGELADLRGEREALTEEIAGLRSSRSWRLTRPMRIAAAGLRRWRLSS
jgi:hypothetical protein